ncbi:hypothetical protein [Reichenbachiella sp.]|uniref:hypothetical protein n=1 Tax=Reichenbachiella sp. TaxID=2184521 RepID=UPI0032997355
MKSTLSIILFCLQSLIVWGQNQTESNDDFELKNDKMGVEVEIKGRILKAEHLIFLNSPEGLTLDGDFGLEIVWTDWMAPGMHNNAENPVVLTKQDFEIKHVEKTELSSGSQQVELDFQGTSSHLQLKMTYLIEPGNHYVRRKIAIRDTIYNKHFLHKINAYDAKVSLSQSAKILKEGGFGQPVALQANDIGFFAGLEYPASTNSIEPNINSGFDLTCSQLKGTKISSQWIESDWVVLGMTPDRAVKKWFMNYVNDIKINPDKPYTLYNSWYDLRGEKYPVGSYVKELHDEDYMTESNVLRLYNLFQKDFSKKYDVELNAFVLDDGWDVYESDWDLNKNEFPNGLTPIKDKFEKNNTSLGLWFGPSGGYSARMKRINWYRANGYEVVGQEKQWGGAQLCLAGKKYSQSFKERTKEFVQQGVSYYKWDGFQFSCSESSHGHPIGLYSQVAVLDTLLSAIEEVHKINPKVYHSVTSGTWLSPWWLKHANQIWMQGEDYGLANVPSYDLKDAAITYRDVVLYDDLQKKKHWFPVSNMMTHGIIKGKLEELYLDTPIDKFVDNAILYFARGVSMYELYTSPDVMQSEEWEVLANALKWAKYNFEILMNTEMVGGDPGEKEPYGYLHLKEKKGIVAARNPFIEKKTLEVTLRSELGLNAEANNLVLEKVYPNRWISPNLYKTGDIISLQLDGYETAIYEVYPIEDTTEPLVAGVPFQMEKDEEGKFFLQYFGEGDPKMLNGQMIKSMIHLDQKISPNELPQTNQGQEPLISDFEVKREERLIDIDFVSTAETTLSFLFKMDKTSLDQLPWVNFLNQGESIPAKFNGQHMAKKFDPSTTGSAWYSIKVQAGRQKIILDLGPTSWKGNIEIWAIGQQSYPTVDLEIQMKGKSQTRVLPPRILNLGQIEEKRRLGVLRL